MAHDDVGQLPFLAELFEEMLAEHASRRVALLGRAGGNGLEHVRDEQVLAVDINADYLDLAAERHGGRIGERLAFCRADLSDPLATDKGFHLSRWGKG